MTLPLPFLKMAKFLPILLLLAMVGPAGSYALDVKGIIDSDSTWTMSDSTISENAIVMERTFDAPVDLIWKMWTDPDHFPPSGSSCGG